jgi:hypothetical protein
VRRLSDLTPGFIVFAVLGWMLTFLPTLILIGDHPRGEPYTQGQLPGLIYTTCLFLLWAAIWLSPLFSHKARHLVLSPQGQSRSAPLVIITPALILILLGIYMGSNVVKLVVGL